MEGEPTKISENDRKLIKTNIVELMLKSPDSIQRQLSEAISIVGREDFPDKWNDLLGVRIFFFVLVKLKITFNYRRVFSPKLIFTNFSKVLMGVWIQLY